MLLRTLAGAYAGQIRDYAYGAAMAALRSGMAARVDDTGRTAGSMREPAAGVSGSSQVAAQTQRQLRRKRS